MNNARGGKTTGKQVTGSECVCLRPGVRPYLRDLLPVLFSLVKPPIRTQRDGTDPLFGGHRAALGIRHFVVDVRSGGAL
jgi:hypothetical protein